MARGFLLTIGLDRLDPAFYPGVGLEELASCKKDARAIQELLSPHGLADSFQALDEAATVAQVAATLAQLAHDACSGDLVVISYSGHGVDLGAFSTAGDPILAWCLYDGLFSDKQLWDSWFAFVPGVRIVLLSDSCHSGTMAREILLLRADEAAHGLDPPASGDIPVRAPEDQPEEVPYRPRALSLVRRAAMIQRNPQSVADVIAAANAVDARRTGTIPAAGVLLMAGCQDAQTSGDGPDHGLFTGSLLDALAAGPPADYPALFASVRQLVRARSYGRQVPNWFPTGDPAVVADLAARPPFVV